MSLLLVITLIAPVIPIRLYVNAAEISDTNTRFTITEKEETVVVFDNNTGERTHIGAFDSLILIVESDIPAIDNILRRHNPRHLSSTGYTHIMTFSNPQETMSIYNHLIDYISVDNVVSYVDFSGVIPVGEEVTFLNVTWEGSEHRAIYNGQFQGWTVTYEPLVIPHGKVATAVFTSIIWVIENWDNIIEVVNFLRDAFNFVSNLFSGDNSGYQITVNITGGSLTDRVEGGMTGGNRFTSFWWQPEFTFRAYNNRTVVLSARNAVAWDGLDTEYFFSHWNVTMPLGRRQRHTDPDLWLTMGTSLLHTSSYTIEAVFSRRPPSNLRILESVGGVVIVDNDTPLILDNVTFTAVPDEGYRLAGWNINWQFQHARERDGNNLTIELGRGYTYVSARFEEVPKLTLNLEANPSEGGIVIGSGVFYAETDYSFPIQAISNDGFEFIAWYVDGLRQSTNATASISTRFETETLNIQARFRPVIVMPDSGAISLPPQHALAPLRPEQPRRPIRPLDVATNQAFTNNGYETRWHFDGSIHQISNTDNHRVETSWRGVDDGLNDVDFEVRQWIFMDNLDIKFTVWNRNGDVRLTITPPETMFSGIQTIWYANGDVYDGQIDFYGRPNGKGTMWYADGQLQYGNWRNGSFVDYEMEQQPMPTPTPLPIPPITVTPEQPYIPIPPPTIPPTPPAHTPPQPTPIPQPPTVGNIYTGNITIVPQQPRPFWQIMGNSTPQHTARMYSNSPYRDGSGLYVPVDGGQMFFIDSGIGIMVYNDDEWASFPQGGSVDILPGQSITVHAPSHNGLSFDHWQINWGSATIENHRNHMTTITPHSDVSIMAVFRQSTPQTNIAHQSPAAVQTPQPTTWTPQPTSTPPSFLNEGEVSLRMHPNNSSMGRVYQNTNHQGSIDVGIGASVAVFPNEQVSISAVANHNYRFSHWEISGNANLESSSNPTTTVTMGHGHVTITAIFTPS